MLRESICRVWLYVNFARETIIALLPAAVHSSGCAWPADSSIERKRAHALDGGGGGEGGRGEVYMM